MALEYWEVEQGKKGNVTGEKMARVLREQYGDVDYVDPKTAVQTVRRELSDLGVPGRIANVLYRAMDARQLRINSASELQSIPDQELLSLRNMGDKNLGALRAVFPYRPSASAT